jgi:hypothetical protein
MCFEAEVSSKGPEQPGCVDQDAVRRAIPYDPRGACARSHDATHLKHDLEHVGDVAREQLVVSLPSRSPTALLFEFLLQSINEGGGRGNPLQPLFGRPRGLASHLLR